MRVNIDTEQCVASGQCVMRAPQVFDQDDDGVVVLLTDRPDDADGDVVRESARGCPAVAITIEE
jgi:ferredoxin